MRLLFAGTSMGLAASACGQGWSNAGGNPGRNGATAEFGPDSASELWSGGRNSIIAWQPVIEGARVFMVRQTGFPPESNRSPVVAMDLDTGRELWATNIPANSGDWTTWVAGARDGRVYAARSGNGASVSARLYCLNAATGAVLWQSAELINAGAYDGVVFAEDGDLIIASMSWVRRINATDGTTVWTTPRVCSVSGNCGGALAPDATGQAVYLADVVPGGHVIKKFDAETGAFLYQSTLMSGFTIQNTPLVGPDGTIYLNRVQNNASVDFFYAFADTGSAIVERWRVASRYTYAAEFAATQDAVFVPFPDNSIRKLRASDGFELESTGVLATPLGAVRMACDAEGKLFVSNGEFAQGRFYCFGPDLRERWSVAVPNINIGAPAIGRDGTLVVAGISTNVKAYRTERRCTADFNNDGFVDFFDYDAFVACFEGFGCPAGRTADVNGDDFVDFFDYDGFVEAFQAGC
ncbi:MAG: PQQ-like beta-propeller repeat protein [Tepidisphaera sp.]